MECFSRSTLGVVIGGINIAGFAFLIIYIIALRFQEGGLPQEELLINTDVLSASTQLCIVLFICVVSLVTSVLLVLGIIKRRHDLMQPWIYSTMVGLGFYAFHIINAIVMGVLARLSFASIFGTIVFGLLMLALQFFIFYLIYTLYTDFRDAASAQEQQCLNNCPQSPPSYSELQNEGAIYN